MMTLKELKSWKQRQLRIASQHKSDCGFDCCAIDCTYVHDRKIISHSFNKMVEGIKKTKYEIELLKDRVEDGKLEIPIDYDFLEALEKL